MYCHTIGFKMKLVSTLVVLTLASGIATSSHRDEKYSLQIKPNVPWPKKIAYGREFKFEMNPELEGIDKTFGMTASAEVTRINQPNGNYALRFAHKFSEMNKPLSPDAKESISEVQYDKKGKEINRTETNKVPTSHLASFMAFEAPTQKVAIGEVWTAKLANPPEGPSTTFGAAQLAGIELVDGTKCFRVEQVFRDSGMDANPTYSTIWIRVSDGFVFKQHWTGSFLPMKIEGTTVIAKATVKLLEG